MHLYLTVVAPHFEHIVQAWGRFWSVTGGRTKRSSARNMQVTSRMQIANPISAIFVHVSMQAEFDILLPQLFEKGILDDLLVPCDGMMPDRNTQDVRVLGQSAVGLGSFDLFRRLEQSSRQRAFVNPSPVLMIL